MQVMQVMQFMQVIMFVQVMQVLQVIPSSKNLDSESYTFLAHLERYAFLLLSLCTLFYCRQHPLGKKFSPTATPSSPPPPPPFPTPSPLGGACHGRNTLVMFHPSWPLCSGRWTGACGRSTWTSPISAEAAVHRFYTRKTYGSWMSWALSVVQKFRIFI